LKILLTKLVLVSTVLLLQSCRIGTATFDGGDVISASGTRDCTQGRTCEFQVNDTNFSETFTAQPRPGYEFVKWRAGEGHLCGDSTNPICFVSNVAGEGDPNVEALVESDTMFYLIPEFECALDACPDILLDSVLLELEEQSRLIDAYVSETGSYPSQSALFGLSTYSRQPPSLLARIDVRPFFPYEGDTIYLSAAVFDSLWDGSGSPSHSRVSYFSLSGSTNAGGTMRWECINGRGYDGGIHVSYLPIQCRAY